MKAILLLLILQNPYSRGIPEKGSKLVSGVFLYTGLYI